MPLLVLSAREAFERAHGDFARWPGRTKGQAGRLRPMAQPAFTPSFRFGPEDLIFTIGSCFARNIERQLRLEGYKVAIDSFALPPEPERRVDAELLLHRYVPQSIANELAWAFAEEPYPDACYYEEPGGWRDLQLHIGAPAAPIEAIRARRKALGDYMRLAAEAKVLVMTVGLAEAWFDRDTGLYLNAAPPAHARKRFDGRFEFHLLGPEEVLAGLERIRDLLARHGQPDLKIMVTVSPVALATTFTGEDILVANTYMKSALRTAVEVFVRSHEGIDYFPSYESVMLSDYRRAWDDDQAHVTGEIVRRNVLAMLQAYGEPSEQRRRALEGLKAYDLLQEAREAARWGRRGAARERRRAAAAMAPDDPAVQEEVRALERADRPWPKALAARLRKGKSGTP